MTYDATDPDSDGVVEANVDNQLITTKETTTKTIGYVNDNTTIATIERAGTGIKRNYVDLVADSTAPAFDVAKPPGGVLIATNTDFGSAALFIWDALNEATSIYHDPANKYGASSGTSVIDVYYDGSDLVVENNAGGSRAVSLTLIS